MASTQVTPPSIRVWAYGLAATALATGLNYGWWWICTVVFDWPVLVPSNFPQSELVDASATRILIATVVAGIMATLGALFIGKIFIGPRWWWAIGSIVVAAFSLYAVAQLSQVNVVQRLRLSMFHLLAIATLIPLLFRALKVGVADLEQTYRAHSSQVTEPEVRPEKEPEIQSQEVVNEQDPQDYSLNDTLIIPPRDDSSL